MRLRLFLAPLFRPAALLPRLLLGVVVLFGLALPPAHALQATPTETRAMTAAEQDHTAYTLPPAKLAKAEELKHSGMVLHFVAIAWTILVLVFLLQSGAVARMRNVGNNISKNRWVQGYVFWLLLLFATTLLALPVELYGHFRLVHAGLSVQGLGSWLQDQAIGFALTLVFGGLGVMLLLLFIRKFPKIWWLPTWIAVNVLTLVGFFFTPYVVDPLFNKFEPLAQTHPELVVQLERVVAKGKGIVIPPERMFLMKASSKTTQLNAYVTGVGSSKRIVVWDTSLAKGTPDEILFIFGHEMGHYVLGHILRGLLYTALISFFLLLFSFYAVRWLLGAFGARWKIPGQNNWGVVAVLLLAISVLMVPEEPLQNMLVRHSEHEADVYGLEVVHGIVADPQTTGQQAFDLLGEGSLAAPDPANWYVDWTATHPPIWLRTAFARAYNPWAPGEAPRYFQK